MAKIALAKVAKIGLAARAIRVRDVRSVYRV
jgi:hypothetical protein